MIGGHLFSSASGQNPIGCQRDWIWRGWRIRYTFIRPSLSLSSRPHYPMLFLHGFGASIGHWRYNLAVLSQTHTVYALDLLGFGGSEKAIAPYNTQLWVDLVYDFWKTFIREPVILVGNSIGSLVSLIVASQDPKLAKGLVLISLPDPGLQLEMLPPWAIPVVEQVQNIVASPPVLRLFFALARRPSFIRRWVGLAYNNPDAITDELVDILVTPALERGAARAFCSILKMMGNPRLGPTVKSLFPQLTIPILLVCGLQDRLIPVKFANPRQYLQYYSQLKLVELENAGHCAHDECPEQVNREILTWLKESFD